MSSRKTVAPLGFWLFVRSASRVLTPDSLWEITFVNFTYQKLSGPSFPPRFHFPGQGSRVGWERPAGEFRFPRLNYTRPPGSSSPGTPSFPLSGLPPFSAQACRHRESAPRP